jgi:hypothetical protein
MYEVSKNYAIIVLFVIFFQATRKYGGICALEKFC